VDGSKSTAGGGVRCDLACIARAQRPHGRLSHTDRAHSSYAARTDFPPVRPDLLCPAPRALPRAPAPPPLRS